MKSYFILLSFFLMINFCKTQIKLNEELNKKIIDPMIDTKEISVYIITNRKVENTNKDCSNRYFRNQPSELRWILCYVNVPKNHSIGSLDTEKKEILDKDLYFYARNFTELTEKKFYEALSKEKEILIFVHGFNVEFEEAIYRASQIKYDLKFQGAVVVFTWPAGPEDGFLKNFLINETYKINQKNAKITIGIFKDFIEKMLNIKNNNKFYLIVHSMGHQIVIPALVELESILTKKKFDEIIFNAPDYPISEWREKEKTIKNIANRITIYCSPKDNALLASETVNGNKRLGQCFKSDGIDVINVNRVDSPILGIGGLGHGYYSSRAILTDLYQLLLGIEVQKRLFIVKSNQSSEDYILKD